MNYREHYFRELCRVVAEDDIIGQQFNDLLVKTGIYLDEQEWAATNRLLEASEQQDHLALSSTASLH